MQNKNTRKYPEKMQKISETGNDFLNNPFKQLDSGNFPKKRIPNAPHGQINELETDESRLFLAAVNSLHFKKKEKKPAGFYLAEQCALPTLAKKSKKQNPVKISEPEIPQMEKDANEFMLAMRNTRPLPAKGRQIAPAAEAKNPPSSSDPDFAALLGGKLEFALLYSDEYLEGRVSDLDDLLMNRLRAGQMSPEAHLDLHGLNALQAFEELKIFIRDSWYKGLRVVLIITGRGRNSPAGQAVLRRKIQSWLTQEPFKRVVLAFCTALPQDGGPGSIYALLRRYRKKGRISWDRLPPDADLY